MDNQIFQIVEGIIVSFGGAAAIIGAIVKLCADTIAERLSRKYEIKLNKELESYKAQLDKKTYISRARFDAEFQIYKDLSEKVLSMVECTYWLFPRGLDQVPMDEEERKKIYLERYKNARILKIMWQLQRILCRISFILIKRWENRFWKGSVMCGEP